MHRVGEGEGEPRGTMAQAAALGGRGAQHDTGMWKEEGGASVGAAVGQVGYSPSLEAA